MPQFDQMPTALLFLTKSIDYHRAVASIEPEAVRFSTRMQF